MNRIITILLSMVLLSPVLGRAQTSVFLDDFNRAALNTNGPATYVQTNSGGGSSTISSNTLVISNGSPAGRSYVVAPVSSYTGSLYNSVLSSSSGVVTWTFNMRYGRTNIPGGFDATNYGVATVLAASSSNLLTGTGYAVVYGGSEATRRYKLVRFSGGLTFNSNLTDVISDVAGAPATTTDYMSIKVTYEPALSRWTLFIRDDGSTAFADPATGTLPQVGNATVNSTYTGSSLSQFGFLWNYSTSAGQTASFDNYSVTVTPACTGPTTASTTFSSSNITSSSADLSFTGGNGDSRIVFISSGSFTTAVPATNTTYTANNDFSGTSTAFDGGKTVYNASGTGVSVTNLAPNTTYNVKVFDYLGTAGSECYNTTALTGTFTTTSGPCAAPNTVNTVTYSGITGTTINGTITSPTGGASGYAVFYSTSATQPALTNGTIYTAANTPAGFNFVQSGTANSFSQSGLSPATTYYFHVVPYNNTSCIGGPAYATPYTSSQATLSPCVAPNAAGNIVFGTSTSNSVNGTYTTSAGGADGYLVFVSTSSTAPTVANGTTYTAANAPAGYSFVQSNTTTSFSASGLAPNTTYYVYVFALNNTGCANGPAYAAVISGSATTPTGPVIVENDGDYRTATSGSWTGAGGGTATWERKVAGVWTSNAAPSFSNGTNRIFIRNTINTAGSFANPLLSILSGGTLTNGSASTAGDLHIYAGGVMQAANTLNVASTGTLEVEDLGTLAIGYTAAGGSGIWNGTENFHPNSNLVINNWSSSSATELVANITMNAYNGYTAAFGNIQFAVTSSVTGNIDLLPGGAAYTGNLAHGNLRFTSFTGSGNVRITTTNNTTSGIGGSLIVDATYPNIVTFKTSGNLDFTIKGNLQIDGSTVRIGGATSGTFNVNVNGNVAVTGTGILDYSPTTGGTAIFAYNVGGNVSVASTATLKNGSSTNPGQLNFVGSAAQTLDIATGAAHTNITFQVNNPSGVQVINNDVNMTRLSLTNGVLTTGTRAITIVSGGVITGGSSSSYVDGKLIWTTNSTTPYVYPMGKAGELYQVTIQPSSATANTFAVTYNKALRGTPGYSNVNAPLTNVNASEYFDITHPTGSSTATITLPWGPGSGVTDPSNIVVAHYNGSSWDNLGGTPTGSITSGSVTVAGVSTFSPFAIGSLTPQPLPVKLADFSLSKTANVVSLNWELQTTDGTETVNLERSTNGKDFRTINTQAATKAAILRQTFTDNAPATDNYYRLAIRGGNGQTSYSKVLTASLEVKDQVRVYPNPATTSVNIEWTNGDQPAQVELHSMTGQLIRHIVTDATHFSLSTGNLVKGAYLLIWKQGKLMNTQQIQVVH